MHVGTSDATVPHIPPSFKKEAAGPRRRQLDKYMRVVRCPSVGGKRLNPQARAVRVAGRTIIETESATIGELCQWFAEAGGLEQGLDSVQRQIATELVKEIRARLKFLLDVGLHYLTLDRPAPTLSGG